MYADDFNPEKLARTAFFTGHRHLPAEVKPHIDDRIYRCLNQAYAAGYRRFFCGCALGFDTLAAFQTVRLRETHPDVSLSLAIPCLMQAERWPEHDRITYGRILDLADDKTVLSQHYYQGVMLARNRYMADRSSLCICYLKYMRGGTASTVRYALLHDRISIVNLAVDDEKETGLLRESTWSCMFISPSVSENAVTAPLCLMPRRKLSMKHI